MGKMKVTVVYLTKEKQKKGALVTLPDDENVGEILEKLVKKLSLVEDEDQGIDTFALYSREKQKLLSKDEALLSQDVKDGEMLILKTKKRPEPIAEENTEKAQLQVQEQVKEPPLLCPICKSEMSKEDVFCSKCGQRLIAKQTIIYEEAKVEEKPEAAEQKKSKGTVLLIALIVLLIVSMTFAIGAVLERRGIIKLPFVITQEKKTELTVPQTTETETTTQEATTIDENLIMVEVTIKNDFIGEGDPLSETLTEEQIERGYTSVKINDDGSVTYKIRKPAWRKILEEFKQDMVKTINDTQQAYEYIEKITYNDDFSEFGIAVNKSLYDSDFDSTVCLSLYIGAGYYQMFDQKEPKCTFTVRDAQSNEVINTMVYPIEND